MIGFHNTQDELLALKYTRDIIHADLHNSAQTHHGTRALRNETVAKSDAKPKATTHHRAQ